MKVNINKGEKLLDKGERKSLNIENKIKIENNLTQTNNDKNNKNSRT